jgi:hypothetical protein
MRIGGIMKNHCTYLALFAGLAMASCKTSHSKPKETEIPADILASKAKLGMGWNADKENFAGVCLNGTTEEVGSQTSSVRFTSSMSKEELHSMLGFSMSAKAKYGVYKGSAAANFSGENSEDKFSSVTVYSARYEFKNEFFTAGDLSPIGARVNEAKDQWEEGCGHEFIQQKVKGASLLIAARIDFVSQEAKSAFSSKFKVKGSAFSVAGELKKASEEFKEKATVSVTAYQKGGDVGRLSTAFASNDGSGGESLIRCSMADVDPCIKVLTNLINYATSKEGGSFPDQIKDNGADGGAADLMYIAYPYVTAGIFPPDTLMRELLYEQRRKVEEKLNRNIFLRNRKNLFSKLTNIPNAQDIYARLDQAERENSLLISDAIRDCFDRIKNTNKENSKTVCQSSLDSLTAKFKDIPDSELEIKQSDLPPCDKGYVRQGMGCERLTCPSGRKYQDTWTESITGGSGNFICDENASDKLTSVSCDGNHEASGLSCIPRSCGTHPHNDTWTAPIPNGNVNYRCDYGVSTLLATNCNANYRANGSTCEAIPVTPPPPTPPPAPAGCTDSRGRVLRHGESSTNNICLGSRGIEQTSTCDNGRITTKDRNTGLCQRSRPGSDI